MIGTKKLPRTLSWNSYYLMVLVIALIGDFLILGFKNFSNDTATLIRIGNHPFDLLLGVSPDPQMPPFLGLALYPAHLLTYLGVDSFNSLRIVLICYSIVAVKLLHMCLPFFAKNRHQTVILVVIYLDFSLLTVLFVQEDVLGYLFILGFVAAFVRKRYITSLIIISLAACTAKILFISFLFPISIYLLKNKLVKPINAILIAASPCLVWLECLVAQRAHGLISVFGYQAPLFLSVNGWNLIPNLGDYSLPALRLVSIITTGVGILIACVMATVSDDLLSPLALVGSWLCISLFAFQPEYLFLIIPYFFFQLSKQKMPWILILIPVAVMQNILFPFSSLNHSGGQAKRDFVLKVVMKLPVLKSPIPSGILSLLFLVMSLMAAASAFHFCFKFLSKNSFLKNSKALNFKRKPRNKKILLR